MKCYGNRLRKHPGIRYVYICHYIHSLPDGSVLGGAQGTVNHDGVRKGMVEESLAVITAHRCYAGAYLFRVVFRFLSNYLAHKAAWYLVGIQKQDV